VPDQGKYLIINWHLENVNNILPSQDEDRTLAAFVVVFAFGLDGVLKSKEGRKKKNNTEKPEQEPCPRNQVLQQSYCRQTLDESNQKLGWLFVQLLRGMECNGVSVELFVNHNCAQK